MTVKLAARYMTPEENTLFNPTTCYVVQVTVSSIVMDELRKIIEESEVRINPFTSLGLI